MKIWSDNGAHYKNTSLVLWLSNLKELTNVDLRQFNNFEPQEGKTKLDSHYATLKFAFKSYLKEKNDITSVEDISKAASGRLRGTHVHEVSIDRGEEPASGNTWTGISQYFSFSYKYDDNGDFKELTAQEQRGLGSTTKLSTARIARLWKDTSSTFGTEVSSKFQVSEAAAVEAHPEKKKTGQVKKSTNQMKFQKQRIYSQLCQCVVNVTSLSSGQGISTVTREVPLVRGVKVSWEKILFLPHP